MEVYILGNCEAISKTDNGGDLYTNAPDDIIVFGSIKYEIVSGEIIEKDIWLEPDWQYRAKITTSQYIEIGDKYPELLVVLNEEPKNPKYRLNDGFVVYFNTFGETQQYIFNELSIVMETKP